MSYKLEWKVHVLGGRIYTTHNVETIAIISIMTFSVYSWAATRQQGRNIVSFFFYYYFHLCLFSSADIFVNDPLFHENEQISVRNKELHSSYVESFILMVKSGFVFVFVFFFLF